MESYITGEPKFYSMKLKKFFLVLLVTVTTTTISAQSKYWAMPDQQITMNPSPSATSLPGNPGDTYSFSSGAFDDNGNLLFYIKDRKVFDDSGASVGELPKTYVNGCNSSGPGDYEILANRPCIVPIPGTCKKFYVIFVNANLSDAKLGYVEIDASGSSVVILSDENVGCEPEPFIVDQSVVQTGMTAPNFVVSKVYTGTGASAERFLYVVGEPGVMRSTIDANGISPLVMVADPSTLGLTFWLHFAPLEVELSRGNDILAWTSIYGLGSVHIIEIDPSTGTYVPSSIVTPNIDNPRGIEFNNSTSSPRLIISTLNGVKRFTLANQSITDFSIGNYDLTNTYLERAQNNRIYGMSPTSNGYAELVGFTTTGSFSHVVPINIDSRVMIGPLAGTEAYSLPKLIDYESVNPLLINGLILDTQFSFLPTGCLGRLPSYCQESTLPLNASIEGSSNEYKLEIFEAVGKYCNPSTNPTDYYYNSGWVNGSFSGVANINNLPDSEGDILENVTGIVGIKLSLRKDCGAEISATGYFNLNDCGSLIVTENGSLENEKFESKIQSIYPNPTTKNVNVQVEITKQRTYSVSLFDSQGKEYVVNAPSLFAVGIQTFQLDLIGYPSGIYTLVIQSNTERLTKPLIIE